MPPRLGRIDVEHKPFSRWSVHSQMIGGEEHWFVDFPGHTNYFVGDRKLFRYDGDATEYIGLRRRGIASIPSLAYNHQDYRGTHGEWASLIQPTSLCESEAKFFVINAWDRAALTLGFFQLAAHTGEHLANLFRELLVALPDEAAQFFPELKLGRQIGDNNRNHIFAVKGRDRLDLDLPAAPADGLFHKRYYRGRFMDFFNPHRGRLDPEEVAAAARWIGWLTTSSRARDVCVTNAVNTAKAAVDSIHRSLLQRGHPKYPKGLGGVSMDLVAAAMDVKHHGRANEGETPLTSIFNAMIAPRPLEAFAGISTGWRKDRSARSVREIGRMRSVFESKAYDPALKDFR